MKVKEIMERAGTNPTGRAVAYIKDGVDKLFLRYTEFIAPIIKAVQELSAKVTALENA